jgi:L-cysteine S-thiosulfotransferase
MASRKWFWWGKWFWGGMWLGAGLALVLPSSGASAAGCIKKTVGYFQELNAAAGPVARPAALALGVAKPLTNALGDATRGRDIAADPERGACLSCHKIAALSNAKNLAYANQGDVGPSLDAVAKRYDEAQLRQRVMDPRVFTPGTIMPAFYKKAGINRPMAKYKDKTILSAQEIEDVVAFLKSLR